MRFATLIDAATLATLVDEGEVTVFDCSFDLADPAAGRRLFGEAHIPGARYLDLDHDLSAHATGSNGRHPLPAPETFAAMLRARGLGQGRQVVAYDRSGGVYAARLWWMLRWISHGAVAVLDGGFEAWRAGGFAIEQGDAGAVAAGDFAAGAVDPHATVDAADVLANLDRSERTIVDARSPERFAGAPHPLDAVSGHIPGAANRFYADNLAGGRFKPSETLRQEWAAVLPDAPDREIVLQCGSGVTACHNALALAVAGIEDVRLYPGSWSEWVADPARPIERT